MEEIREEIIFKNDPFNARVSGEGNGSMKCVPLVVDVNEGVSRYRLAVYCKGRKKRHYIVSEDVAPWSNTSNDLIAGWRGMEILRHFDHINKDILQVAYYAGVRYIESPHIQSYVDLFISGMDQKVYEEIMSAMIPEDVVRKIVDIQEENKDPANLLSIAGEVSKGTIRYGPLLAELGMKMTNRSDRKTKGGDLFRFEKALISYAVNKRIPRESGNMYDLERVLLKLIEKGVYRSYSEREIVAIAGILSEMQAYEPLRNARNAAEFEKVRSKMKTELIGESLVWIFSGSVFAKIFSWKADQKIYNSAEKKLRGAVDKYFHLASLESHTIHDN